MTPPTELNSRGHQANAWLLGYRSVLENSTRAAGPHKVFLRTILNKAAQAAERLYGGAVPAKVANPTLMGSP